MTHSIIFASLKVLFFQHLAFSWISAAVTRLSNHHGLCSVRDRGDCRRFNFDDQGRRLYGDDLLIPECERSPINGVRACTPRHHFDTFQWGFVCIFQILSGENWNEVMYDGMRSVGWFGCSFFIAVVVIGSFIVFNLFLAILMSGFEEESNKVREREKKKKEAKLEEAEKKETQGIFLKVMAGQKSQMSISAKRCIFQIPSGNQGNHSFEQHKRSIRLNVFDRSSFLGSPNVA